MKSIFYLLIYLFFLQFSYAQTFVLEDSISIENKVIKKIDTDLNQSLYLISETKIEKIFSNKKTKTYNSRNIISSIDSSNPLRLYIYSNFNRLDILDEQLNPIQDPITISSTDFMPAALKVVDNQFCWFYDIIGNKLVYYNYQLQKPILNSKSVYLKNNDQSIENIHVYKNLVFLKAPKTIYVYDDYGNFKTNFMLETENSPFHFYKNALFYIKNNKLFSINLENQQTTPFLDLVDVKSIAFNETNLFTLTNNYIYVYGIK
ncbi:hypothetical protein SAMN05421738_11634 [Algoriella xinjiangensis]|uniref:Uncharacterized protein n=1 Tax=Algoriella xinjiangensis TaxID=684065 RepID=A0A1I5AC16_9FLAO|nr:hypothetical protein [Algoriella xinjiangensis]SFN59976.1 hypothetical protein SAMN05421738_11634 [Algoriella xinjiangensis]VDH16468.1 Uncharacterised protein [Algoriella xinjiangensis]